MFITFFVAVMSLRVNINDKEYSGDSYESILAEYGEGLDTITSINAIEGQFPLNTISPEYVNLATIDVPAESFQGQINNAQFKGMGSLINVVINGVQSVGTNSFESCSNLKFVELKNCISVGDSSFKDCVSLETIDMPKLQKIGKYGFQNTGLIEVELNSANDFPDSYHNAHQFAKCLKLTKITLKMATRISSNCFLECAQLSYVDAPLVTAIDYYSFSGCNSFYNLTFPSVTWIGEGAFKDNSLITEVKLDSLNSIEGSSFEGCTNLKNAELLNIVSIGDSSFKDCVSLETIDMPKLQKIGKYGFQNTGLIEVELNSANDFTDSYHNAHQFCLCQRLRHISMKTASKVTSYMFESCVSLESLELDSCTWIEQTSFTGCSSIKSFVLGFGVIESSTVPFKADLFEISLPKATILKEGAFYNCKQMTTCKLPSVITIEKSAFQNCNLLTELEIPKVTEFIGDDIFFGCENLVSLSLRLLMTVDPTAVNTFAGCNNLKYISLPNNPPKTFNPIAFNNINCVIYIPKNSISKYDNDVSIEGDLVNDGKWCGIVLQEHQLIKIKVNKNEEEEIEDRTLFDACRLSGVRFSNIIDLEIIEGLISQNELKLIKDRLIKLESLIIDEGVSIEGKIIPSLFFQYNKQIKSVTIKCEIDSIEESAFEGCENLQDFNCATVKELKSKCFNGPTSLNSISLSNVATLTGSNFFSNNPSLETIELPKLTMVTASGFISEKSPNIKSIKLPEEPPTVSDSFSFDISPTLIGISKDAAKNYDSNDGLVNMKYYSLKLNYDLMTCLIDGEMIGGLSLKGIIPENAKNVEVLNGEITESDFPIPSSIVSLTISEDVVIKEIPANAMMNHPNLNSLAIYSPNAYLLGEQAFLGCKSLETVVIKGATVLNGYVFKSCPQLKSALFSDIQEIKGNSHFEDCFELTSVSFPSLTSVPSDSSRIFINCNKLNSIHLPSTPPKTFNSKVFTDVKQQLTLLLPNENDYLTYDDDESIENDVKNDGFWCGLLLSVNTINIKINQQSEIYKGIKLSDCIAISSIQISLITSIEIIRGTVPVSDFMNLINELISLETLIVSSSVEFEGEFSEITFTNSKLQSITLPQMDTIKENCFKNCINLKNVILDGAKTIKDSAFEGCISLEEIFLNVETFVGDSHFKGCTSLKTIKINKLKTVDPLSENLFSGCSLKNLYLPKIPPKTFNKNTFINMNVLINGLNNDELKVYDQNTEVEDDIIGDNKWCGIDLYPLYIKVSINGKEPILSTSISEAIELCEVETVTTVEIQQGMVKSTHFKELNNIESLEKLTINEKAFLESSIISSDQFQANKKITEIKIYQQVSLMPSCFKDLTLLTTVEFSEVDVICESCFSGCSSLASIKIPRCKELRGDSIFSGCTSLTEIDLSSLKTVDEYATNIFENCNQLTIIKLPSEEPTTFNKLSFADCPNIQIQLPKDNDYVKYDDESHVEGDIKEDSKWCGIEIDQSLLPPILTFIINGQEYTQRKIENIREAQISSLKLLEIEMKTLELKEGLIDPNDLKEVTRNSKTLEKFEAQLDTLAEIETGTFDGCEKLTEIIIHPEVIIRYKALQNIPNLAKVTLNMQKAIRNDEFQGDIELQEITLPQLKIIPNDLFADLSKLQTVKLNEASIMLQGCFKNCALIESIELPSIKIMDGDSHFEGCSNLKTIDLSNLIGVNQESPNIFKDCDKLNELKLGVQPPSTFHENIFAVKVPKISIPDEKYWRNYVKQSVVNEENNHYFWYGFDTGIEHNENDNFDCPVISECPSQIECSCPEHDDTNDETNTGKGKGKSVNIAALVVGIILGIAVIVLVVIIIIMFTRNRKNSGSETEVSDI